MANNDIFPLIPPSDRIGGKVTKARWILWANYVLHGPTYRTICATFE